MESTSTWDTGISVSIQQSALRIQQSVCMCDSRHDRKSVADILLPLLRDLAVKDLVSAVQQFASVALAIITGCGRVGGLALGRDQEEGLWLPI